MIAIGRKLYSEAKYQEAELVYTTLIQEDSSRVEAYYFMGVTKGMLCHNLHEGCDESILYLSKAIAIDPTFRKAYYNRALSELHLEEYNKAISDLNKAIELDSTDSDYFRNRGGIYYILGNKERACEDTKHAIRLGAEYRPGQLDTICNQ